MLTVKGVEKEWTVINMRLFVRDTTKWLKAVPLLVTVRGVVKFAVLAAREDAVMVPCERGFSITSKGEVVQDETPNEKTKGGMEVLSEKTPPPEIKVTLHEDKETGQITEVKREVADYAHTKISFEVDRYGCGCVKAEGRTLCPKHSRV